MLNDEVEEAMRILDNHFDAWLLAVEIQDDDLKSASSEVFHHGGFNRCFGLAARAVCRFQNAIAATENRKDSDD
jgi:hypothetical protein